MVHWSTLILSPLISGLWLTLCIVAGYEENYGHGKRAHPLVKSIPRAKNNANGPLGQIHRESRPSNRMLWLLGSAVKDLSSRG